MITVFGSINLDLIGNVATLPRPGQTVIGTTFAIAPGGKGANQALAARRAGSAVRMVGAVGDDAFAPQALALLVEEGVDLSGVDRVPGHTGCAMILVDGAGENVISVLPGANQAARAASLGGKLAAGDVLVLQLEIPVAEVVAAARIGRDAGATVIFNLAPSAPIDRTLLDQLSVLVMNETEAADLTAHLFGQAASPAEAAERLADLFDGWACVTLGRRGALAARRGAGTIAVPALAIEPLDTVGAGDTFVGYLAAALESGLGMEAALRRAAIAGSLACLHPGAQPSIPRMTDVLGLRGNAAGPSGSGAA